MQVPSSLRAPSQASPAVASPVAKKAKSPLNSAEDPAFQGAMQEAGALLAGQPQAQTQAVPGQGGDSASGQASSSLGKSPKDTTAQGQSGDALSGLGKDPATLTLLSGPGLLASKSAVSAPQTTARELKPGVSGLQDVMADYASASGKIPVESLAPKVGSAPRSTQPWSKDWVFQGGEELDPSLKTLFGSKANDSLAALMSDTKTAVDAQILQAKKALAEAGAAVDAAHANEPGAQAGAAGALTQAQAADPFFRAHDSLASSPGAFHHMQGMGPQGMDPGMAGLMGSMNGMVEGLDAVPESPVSNASQAQAPGARKSAGISGGAFLETLNGAKAKAGARGSFGPAAPEGEGSQQTQFGANAARNGLQVIDGGKAQSTPVQPLAGPMAAIQPKSAKASLAQRGFGSESASDAGAQASVMGMAQHPGTQGAQTGFAVAGANEMTGHVTLGAGSRERLSTESLGGVATQIRSFGSQGGGEMKIRLKPDNLGELHLKIQTQGGAVGIQIQASSEKAKQVIEESMGHLKESLAAQNMSLASVDVQVQASGESTHADSHQQQQQQHAQSQGPIYQDFMAGQNFNQGSAQREQSTADADSAADLSLRRAGARSALSAAAQASSAGRSSRMDSGRLDVMA